MGSPQSKVRSPESKAQSPGVNYRDAISGFPQKDAEQDSRLRTLDYGLH